MTSSNPELIFQKLKLLKSTEHVLEHTLRQEALLHAFVWESTGYVPPYKHCKANLQIYFVINSKKTKNAYPGPAAQQLKFFFRLQNIETINYKMLWINL